MLNAWILAVRPKTLVASIMPVCVGGSYFGFSDPDYPWLAFFCCLSFAVLIQVATNLANDYFDGLKGTDDERAFAPRRMVADGLISPGIMFRLACAVLLFAFLIGCSAVLLSGASWYFFPFGAFCVVLALAYTGGPIPLAYNGMGDLFVIVFFGICAVEGTKILISSATGSNWTPDWQVSLGIGLLINNLLVVNNYRDYKGDSRVGKNTTIVLFGRPFGQILYLSALVLPTIVFPLLFDRLHGVIPIAIPGIVGWMILRKARSKRSFDLALALSVLCVLSYGCVLCFWGLL